MGSIPLVKFICKTILFFILISPLFSGVYASSEWTNTSPDDPLEDENVDITFFTTNTSQYPIQEVRLILSDKLIEVEISGSFETIDNEWKMICECSITFEEAGNITLKVEHLIEGKWEPREDLTIIIGEKEDSKEDTIFGLPRWYCSVSIIIITLIIIFFTWSYFKGRKMKREMSTISGKISIQCSECGKEVGTEEIFCPWCGVSLDEEEFICGKCQKPVKPDDVNCPNCKASLLPEKKNSSPTVKKNEIDLKKKMKIEKVSKRTCDGCGAVLMKNERTCPVCKK